MREIPILVGIGILLVFIILVLIAILFVRPVKKAGNQIEEKQLRRKLRRTYFAILITGTLAIVSLGTAVEFASKASFCASCHEMKAAFDDSKRSIHSKVPCEACHQEPGLTGVFIDKLRLVEMVSSKSKILGNVTSAQVTNEVCLRCHKSVLHGKRQSGAIVMQHKEPLDAGYRCVDCHYQKPVLHSTVKRLDSFGMSTCIDCHNQKQASAECDACHAFVLVGQTRAHLQNYPRAEGPGEILCKSCHGITVCLNCHNLQLPHLPAWRNGGHALEGFIDKTLCWECHTSNDCRTCHAGGFPHTSDWVAQHGMSASSQGGTCSNCHNPNFCTQCHTDSRGGALKPHKPTHK
jgi:nitrate/TMAO reductase-like tetraheme cytochrome c subunit